MDETTSVVTMEEGHCGHNKRRRGEATQVSSAPAPAVEQGGVVDGRGADEEAEAAAAAPSTCSICMEPWICNGEHRICCIPCGHVYGRSCLEKWLEHTIAADQCGTGGGGAKCPQCGEKFEQHDIINLYAPGINIWAGCCQNHANEVGEYYRCAFEEIRRRVESRNDKLCKELEELRACLQSISSRQESLELSIYNNKAQPAINDGAHKEEEMLPHDKLSCNNRHTSR